VNAPLRLANALDVAERLLTRYVAFGSPHQVVASTLWVAHTHAVAVADTTPYLAILSAEKRSGKTRLLDVLELLVSRPWRPVEPSDAVVYSMMEQRHPTLLLDEADALFGSKLAAAQHEALRGILNASNRRGTPVARLEMYGRERRLAEFDAFGPKAFAGIRTIPDTLRDRSIIIELRRRAPSETVERFRRRDAAPEAAPVKAALVEALASVDLVDRPELPAELDDRAADGWEPLLAIADAAGGEWPAKARRAALALSGERASEDESQGVRLLADIREVFRHWPGERIPSAELVHELCSREESPWGDLNGRTLTMQRLAGQLRPYGIRPALRRVAGEPERSYVRAGFADAWARYLGPLPEEEPSGRYVVTDELTDASTASTNDVPRNDVTRQSPLATGGPAKDPGFWGWPPEDPHDGPEEQTTWTA
jgi:Protein of unknown function (DUF3631)